MKRQTLLGLASIGALAFAVQAACSLNPQPLPPLTGTGGSDGSGGTTGTGAWTNESPDAGKSGGKGGDKGGGGGGRGGSGGGSSSSGSGGGNAGGDAGFPSPPEGGFDFDGGEGDGAVDAPFDAQIE